MMKSIQKQVKVVLSPSKEQYAQIRAEFEAQTGSTSFYDNRELWESLEQSHRTVWELNDITFKQAQAFAEPIRIAHPDQNVSLYNEDAGSYIGNVTWNDQLKMFWEYPTYTKEGAEIMSVRQTSAKEEGLIASWE